MTSLGKNYFKELLHYTTDHTKNDTDAIKMERELQFRLANYFQDNPTPTLLFSKKYSGMVDYNDQKEPLGGSINPLRAGENNVPSSGACPPEFPFWSFSEKKKDKKNENENEKDEKVENHNDLIENFTNEDFKDFGIKENFDGSTIIPIIVGVIVLIVVLLILYFSLRGQNIPPISTENINAF